MAHHSNFEVRWHIGEIADKQPTRKIVDNHMSPYNAEWHRPQPVQFTDGRTKYRRMVGWTCSWRRNNVVVAQYVALRSANSSVVSYCIWSLHQRRKRTASDLTDDRINSQHSSVQYTMLTAEYFRKVYMHSAWLCIRTPRVASCARWNIRQAASSWEKPTGAALYDFSLQQSLAYTMLIC